MSDYLTTEFLHSIQSAQGWEYTTTWAWAEDEFDPDKAPLGEGWVRNVDKAGGFEERTVSNGSGRRQQLSYWRREKA